MSTKSTSYSAKRRSGNMMYGPVKIKTREQVDHSKIDYGRNKYSYLQTGLAKRK